MRYRRARVCGASACAFVGGAAAQAAASRHFHAAALYFGNGGSYASNVVRGTGRFTHAAGHLAFSSQGGNFETAGPVPVTIAGRLRY